LFCAQQAWLFVVFFLVPNDVTKDDDKPIIIFLLFLVVQKITLDFDSQSSYVPFKFNSSSLQTMTTSLYLVIIIFFFKLEPLF